MYEFGAKNTILSQASKAVVHFDGKLLPDIGSKENVDRLPVLISQYTGHQLLGVPKIESGSGENTAEAVYQLMTDWNIADGVVASCFDTTSANTGPFSGALVLLEGKLRRKLLALPCRHHMLELRLKSAFEAKFGNSSGPNVPLFVRFQKSWININTNNFKSGLIGNENGLLNHDDVITFCKNELKKNIVRHDYKELLQLCLIFLGDATVSVSFRAPGAMHHARWMAKALYALKIYIFRNEFKLTSKEEKSLRDLCWFIVLIYVKAWFSCTIATAAPKQDFDFIKIMLRFRDIDPILANAVIRTCCNQLWYLADETIALSLFDKNVSKEEKDQIRKVLINQIATGDVTHQNKVHLNPSRVESFCLQHLSDFVTENTIHFFERFEISKAFLEMSPELWESDTDYMLAVELLQKLEVVNDLAERGVKLIEDYNQKITKNEEELQYLLQTVQAYRKLYPDFAKHNMAK